MVAIHGTARSAVKNSYIKRRAMDREDMTEDLTGIIQAITECDDRAANEAAKLCLACVVLRFGNVLNKAKEQRNASKSKRNEGPE